MILCHMVTVSYNFFFRGFHSILPRAFLAALVTRRSTLFGCVQNHTQSFAWSNVGKHPVNPVKCVLLDDDSQSPSSVRSPYKNSRRINIYCTTTVGLLEGWSINQCLTETWTAGHFELQKAQPPQPICATNLCKEYHFFCHFRLVHNERSRSYPALPQSNRLCQKAPCPQEESQGNSEGDWFHSLLRPSSINAATATPSGDWINTSYAAFLL